MQLNERSLMVRNRGDDVATLHSALDMLGYKIPPDELDEDFYGQGTKDAVCKFQQDNRMSPTGIFCQSTADQLCRLGVFIWRSDMELNEKSLMVRSKGADVKRLHELLARQGHKVPADEVKREFFGQGTRNAVYKYQTKSGLSPSGVVDLHTSAKLAKAMNS